MSHIKSPSQKLLTEHEHLCCHYKIIKDTLLSIDPSDIKVIQLLKSMEIDMSILKAQIELKIKRAEQKFKNENDRNETARDIFFLMGRKG